MSDLEKLNEENLALHRELAEVRLQLGQMTQQWESQRTIARLVTEERADLAAKCGRLEPMAKRYEWLRHGDNDERVVSEDCRGLYLARNEALDEKIDREMAKDAAAQWAPVSAEQQATIEKALGKAP